MNMPKSRDIHAKNPSLKAILLNFGFVSVKVLNRYKKYMKRNDRMTQSACDTCAYYSYDEDYECYVCDMDLDEDELVRFLSDTHYQCPYYRNGDEYAVVRKQI